MIRFIAGIIAILSFLLLMTSTQVLPAIVLMAIFFPAFVIAVLGVDPLKELW